MRFKKKYVIFKNRILGAFLSVCQSDLSETPKVRRRRFKCRTCMPLGEGP